MKCREELAQIVMAIFYKVDPYDVKMLTGEFGKVFKNTCVGKTKSKEDIKRWRHALGKVATIAGLYHSSKWDNEAAMIERITTDVSNELIRSAPSSDFNSLVGIRTHKKKMEPFLGLKSRIGKSTIARFLFGEYSHKFQLSVFMDNIKRRYPNFCHDEYSTKLQLQKDFLSQIINHEDIKIHHLGVARKRQIKRQESTCCS
ncbi:putative disease resistance protein RPP1 [Cardamine amara subsp. amara]|uniref:Disease resistance protein RPP1 n=1 Tax=Cardamine amara subsp. amara TaxID=228776 RepID=A0ABD1A4N5_CARAN